MLAEPFHQQVPMPDYADISDLLTSDLFAFGPSPSSASPASSSSSPRSPPDPFTAVTPPQSTTSFPIISQESDFFNNFNLIQEDFSKQSSMFAMPAPSSEPFDFLGALTASGFSSSESPASSSSISSNPSATDMCIDPQLVGSPSVAEDEEDEGEESQSHEDDPTSPASQPEPLVAPIKVAGHGKGRKGTVQSGGITKKTSKDKENKASIPVINSVPFSLPASIYKEEDDNDDLPADWRPPPEVYAKMSSKEKRQLRNKISARNFRIRRKEYITTLEGDIAERDRILQAIRSELGSSRSENVALRQEIAALKKALLSDAKSSGAAGATSPQSADLAIESILNLPPPAPLPEVSAAEMLASKPSTPAQSTTQFSSELNLPNTQKDLPTSPRVGQRGFWGGAHIGLGGGITPVHTAIMPEWQIRNVQNLPNVGQIPQAPVAQVQVPLQENLNPALNQGRRDGLRKANNTNLTPFEKFTDSTLLTYPSMDPYRMQLWKLVAAQNATRASQANNNRAAASPPALPQGLAASLRPSFFSANVGKFQTPSQPQSPPPIPGSSLSGILSGKSKTGLSNSSSSYNSTASATPTTPPTSTAAGPAKKDIQQAQKDMMIATLASQTLVSRLGSAFWDAFSGGSSSSSSNSTSANKKSLDADKVRKVLEGKAVVKVVDVDSSLTSSMSALSMSSSTSTKTVSPPTVPSNAHSCVSMADLSGVLEEGMRSLTLGRKH